MDKDYYDTLGIERNADPQQIADSYRRLSLRWNPKTAKQDKQTSSYHFSQIAQAYDVLIDPIKRAYYDKHGWKKLTQQFYQSGGLTGGYRFRNNAQDIFTNFMNSNTSFDLVLGTSLNTKGSLFSQAFGGLNYHDNKLKQDLIINVYCTLNQLYKGQPKKIQYQKKILNLDGRSLSLKQHQKLLQIKPGYSKNTKLRFISQGNQSIQKITSDLVFQICQIPHQYYSRCGNDLIYNAKITLAQAISCRPLEIITLDDRKLRVSLDQIPNPQNLKQITGEGMPITDTLKKGNLYLKFQILFPKSIPQNIKNQLKILLS